MVPVPTTISKQLRIYCQLQNASLVRKVILMESLHHLSQEF
jgi:hypothetical protein